jgi:lactoylglutathione lyase
MAGDAPSVKAVGRSGLVGVTADRPGGKLGWHHGETAMNLAQLTAHSGIILKTERFSDCVQFYRDLLGFPVWFAKDGLCCLRFGSGYLMVETGRVAGEAEKTVATNPTVLRFHVPDLGVAAETLRRAGVPVAELQFDWGSIGAFVDPDGNPCELAEAWDPDATG